MCNIPRSCGDCKHADEGCTEYYMGTGCKYNKNKSNKNK